jgi:hypothetical protein
MGFWKSLAGTALTAAVTVGLSKGAKAKPRDMVYELGRSMLQGRVRKMDTAEFVSTMADEIELVTDDGNMRGQMRYHVTRNAPAIMASLAREFARHGT